MQPAHYGSAMLIGAWHSTVDSGSVSVGLIFRVKDQLQHAQSAHLLVTIRVAAPGLMPANISHASLRV